MDRRIIVSFAFIFFSSLTFAQANNGGAENALKETQDLLRDRSKLQNVLQKDSKAKTADDQVQSLTGGNAAQSQRIYDVSSDALSSLMQTSGNDPAKAAELLQKAQANPEAFYNSLPADLREKIRGLASDIEKNKATTQSP